MLDSQRRYYYFVRVVVKECRPSLVIASRKIWGMLPIRNRGGGGKLATSQTRSRDVLSSTNSEPPNSLNIDDARKICRHLGYISVAND